MCWIICKKFVWIVFMTNVLLFCEMFHEKKFRKNVVSFQWLKCSFHQNSFNFGFGVWKQFGKKVFLRDFVLEPNLDTQVYLLFLQLQMTPFQQNILQLFLLRKTLEKHCKYFTVKYVFPAKKNCHFCEEKRVLNNEKNREKKVNKKFLKFVKLKKEKTIVVESWANEFKQA